MSAKESRDVLRGLRRGSSLRQLPRRRRARQPCTPSHQRRPSAAWSEIGCVQCSSLATPPGEGCRWRSNFATPRCQRQDQRPWLDDAGVAEYRMPPVPTSTILHRAPEACRVSAVGAPIEDAAVLRYVLLMPRPGAYRPLGVKTRRAGAIHLPGRDGSSTLGDVGAELPPCAGPHTVAPTYG